MQKSVKSYFLFCRQNNFLPLQYYIHELSFSVLSLIYSFPSSNVVRWSELCSRLCSSRIELRGKDESVVVGDQMSQSPPQPSCRQEEDVSPSAPPPDFDTLFPGPLLPDNVQDKNDGVIDYSSIPDEDFELKSNNPRPWPSIDSVSSEGRYLLDLMRRPAFASEKLDGSNVSISSRGLVCSRRCVIAKR